MGNILAGILHDWKSNRVITFPNNMLTVALPGTQDFILVAALFNTHLSRSYINWVVIIFFAYIFAESKVKPSTRGTTICGLILSFFDIL